jgi:hypothetical protein
MWILIAALLSLLWLGSCVEVEDDAVPDTVVVEDNPDIVVEDTTPDVVVEDKTPDIDVDIHEDNSDSGTT